MADSRGDQGAPRSNGPVNTGIQLKPFPCHQASLSRHYIFQVVAFPVVGSAVNLSPFLKNTTIDEVHLYGPDTAQIEPVVPLALTLIAVVSLMVVSP